MVPEADASLLGIDGYTMQVLPHLAREDVEKINLLLVIRNLGPVHLSDSLIVRSKWVMPIDTPPSLLIDLGFRTNFRTCCNRAPRLLRISLMTDRQPSKPSIMPASPNCSRPSFPKHWLRKPHTTWSRPKMLFSCSSIMLFSSMILAVRLPGVMTLSSPVSHRLRVGLRTRHLDAVAKQRLAPLLRLHASAT